MASEGPIRWCFPTSFSCLPSVGCPAIFPRSQQGPVLPIAAPSPPRQLPEPLELKKFFVEIREALGLAPYDLQLSAKALSWEAEDFASLSGFLSGVLESHAVPRFVVTYDIRKISHPQLDMINSLRNWIEETDARQRVWRRKCRCWRIVAEGGMPFYYARGVLSIHFYSRPADCDVFLVSSLEERLDDGNLFWQASTSDDEFQATPSNVVSCELSGLMHTFRAQSGHTEYFTPMGDSSPAAFGISASPVRLDSPREVGSPVARNAPPPTLDVGFALLKQGLEEGTGIGYLHIIGKDNELTDDGLTRMMDFMDAVVASPVASKGFSITYDMTSLRMPSMAMVQRVAEWGGHPERERMWKELNKACKVVVGRGYRYTLCQGVLSAFFFACPPIVPTFLMTHLDQPESEACRFEPPAAAAAVASV